jgi:ParB-like chromosome segregation protein Spo0J
MSDTSMKMTSDGFAVYCAYDNIELVDSLKPNPNNPNRHPTAQIELLAKILKHQGWRAPITVSRRSGLIVRGHARRLAAIEAGSGYAPVDYQDYDNDEAELADLIADNRIAELAVLDESSINELVMRLSKEADGIYAELAGYSAEQVCEMAEQQHKGDSAQQVARATLQERFIIPPFNEAIEIDQLLRST